MGSIVHISFDDGWRFVISPNAPVRRIWISALATSFKLGLVGRESGFCAAEDRRKLKPLVLYRLINQQLGEETILAG